MKKIMEWLAAEGLEYDEKKFGNPYYFNDGFYVEGISVPFFFDNIGNAWEKQQALERYMKRKRSYVCRRERFGAGVTYRIMTVFDAARLEKHENAVASATEAFWQAEHARRVKEACAL